MAQNLAREDSAVVPSCVFAGVGGYYASKQSGLAGVFRRAADSSDWKHALREIEAFAVFVHPRDPNLVFAGTADGVYRSTDRGQNFRRADFPDRGVQVWSFLQDDADPKWMLAGGSPVSIYFSRLRHLGSEGSRLSQRRLFWVFLYAAGGLQDRRIQAARSNAFLQVGHAIFRTSSGRQAVLL